MSAPRDPIGLELFRNALLSIADEMALTILRTAYSGVLKDNMDYSTALADADGQTVAQGLTLPAHLASFPDAIAATLARFRDRMRPGDVYCLNDPFEGGMHLPDVFILKPIFYEGVHVAFAATVCHQIDMGGRVAGSNASDSTEIFQEGLRIPPVALYEAGAPNETLFRLIEKNVRLPEQVLGDMRAQLAACHIAEQGVLRLCDAHGASTVRTYLSEILDHTELMTRAALRDLPDGEWSFTDWIDDDGIEFGKAIPLKVTLRKRGDRLIADWTGSAAQVRGAINNTLSYTKAATYTCIMSVLPRDSTARSTSLPRQARLPMRLRLPPVRRAASPGSEWWIRASARWRSSCRIGSWLRRRAAIPACPLAAILPIAGRSSSWSSSARPGAAVPGPTVSTATRTCSRTCCCRPPR